jgi:tetratricopeptide (TPR) repeat protein
MNVANALAVDFLAGEIDRLEQSPTRSREAYELYLAAIAARLPGTVEGRQRAIALLNEALVIDSTYVQAWALLSNLQTIDASGNPALLDEALAAAETAIELEPSNGVGYAQLGFALGQRNEWQTAEAAYQRALELGWPLANMPEYSTQQLAVGHIEQAIYTLESNLESDPMNQVALGFLMSAYDTRGDVAKADELYERGRTLHGDWPFGRSLSTALRLGRGDIEFLRDEIRPFAQGINAELLDAVDDPNSMREALLKYISDPTASSPGQASVIAVWAAYSGEVDLAAAALRDAAVGSGLLIRLGWEPLFSDVRSTPEFTSLIDDLGLIEYWNKTEWPEFCQQLSDGEVECR